MTAATPRGLRPRIWTWVLFAALSASACLAESSTDPPEPTSSDLSTATTAATVLSPGDEPLFSTKLADAVSANVVSGVGGNPAVAWITQDGVHVARIDLSSGGLIEEIEVSGAVSPIAHPIERPAIAFGANGDLTVAFTSRSGSGGSVFNTTVNGAGAKEPKVISGSPRPETNLVHATSDGTGSPLFAWLEDSTLSVATSSDGEFVENESVDDLTCDCCNPAPLFMNDGKLVVAFRDYDVLEGRVVRDVVAIRSDDGGISFDQVVPVADDHWFIDACPFTGPSAVEVDGTLLVAWMDARQSIHPDQASSTIWVDRSTDDGRTFGEDAPVAAGAIHRWPVMTVDEQQTVHMVWETQGSSGGLSYSSSTDSGTTFSEPRLLWTPDTGSPRSPSIAHQDDHLIVTWTDGKHGHVTVWALEERVVP